MLSELPKIDTIDTNNVPENLKELVEKGFKEFTT